MTLKQIQAVVDRVGQPRATSELSRYFASVRTRLDSSDVENLYDARYRKVIRDHEAWKLVEGKYKIHHYNKYSFQYLESRMPQPVSVLEIGCGTGDFLLALSGLRRGRFVGLDFSREMIRQARKKAGRRGARCEFHARNVSDLSLKDPFDFIVLNDVSEHLSDRELNPLFEKAARVLKPGGEMILHTPNGLALCNETDWSLKQLAYKTCLRWTRGWRGFEKSPVQLYYEQVHINVKSFGQLRGLLGRAGWDSRVIYDADGSPGTFLRDLAPNMLVIAKRR